MANETTINKIRNILIPTLKDEYNSNIKQSIIRMKNVLEKDEEFLNNYTQNIVNNALIDKLIFFSSSLKSTTLASTSCPTAKASAGFST